MPDKELPPAPASVLRPVMILIWLLPVCTPASGARMRRPVPAEQQSAMFVCYGHTGGLRRIR